MAPKQRPAIRVTSTTDLLALIPYLLGFHPECSLVQLAVNDNGRLTSASLRTLPTVDEPLGPLHFAVDQVATTITEHAGAGVLLAGYGTAEQVEPAVSAATAALIAAGITIHETLRVADGRFWQLGCEDPDACPPAGVPFDTADSPLTATSVNARLVTLPDRAALVAALTPVTGLARDRMITATAAACVFLTGVVDAADPTGTSQHTDARLNARVARALHRLARTYLSQARDMYQARKQVDDEQAAGLTVLLDLPSLYGFAVRQTTGERWQVEMWSDLVRRAEPEFTAAPATLLALAAIRAGNSALADVAVQRALDVDPDDPSAQVIASAIAAGIDPDAVFALLAGS